MKTIFVALAIATALHAEDVPRPTLEEQLATKDQQIAQLQRQIVLIQREGALHQQAYFGCLDQLEEKQKPQMPTKPVPKPKP